MSDATTAINGTNKNGGAMDFVDSHVAIENCLFSNHAAPDGAGGAIHFVGGTLNVTGTEFHNNTAKDGGAVAVKKNATVRIRNSTFRGNQATNAGGAGIFKRGIVIVEDPVFVQNSASTMVSPFASTELTNGDPCIEHKLTDDLPSLEELLRCSTFA